MKKILFLHPDLGIGGAERLVVDAALALVAKGHKVEFVTTHHDTSHCFIETKDGSLPVTVVGDWIPRNVLGKFCALFAYLRMIYAAIYIVLFSGINPDIIFCDIVSACIPILKLSRSYVIFYCHFPDQLQSSPGGTLKRLYRVPLDWIEEKTTGSADVILVNSQFTRKIFQQTFTTIDRCPQILYPSINTAFFDQANCDLKDLPEASMYNNKVDSDSFIFLSINRFERKKNISLAINALPVLKRKLSEREWSQVQLVVAGGYDNRVVENVEHFKELVEETKQCEMEKKVAFYKSPSDLLKLDLLEQSTCLLYTPSNEHFGIVPLEAMYMKKPVIAINSGGPRETVEDGVTGYLCEPTAEHFSTAMANYVKNPNKAKEMGRAGRTRFEEKFSFEAFRDNLNLIIENLGSSKNK